MKNNRFKIAAVANNYGKAYDGVGAYAGVQGKELEKYADVVVYTSMCNSEESKIKKFFCMGMTKQLCTLNKDISRFDVVIIDYLFVEWNPAILLPIFLLNHRRKKYGCRLVISLHEYNRVNKLRKLMIKSICSMADLLFVADENLKKSVKTFGKKTVIRPIPSNLYNQEILDHNVPKDRNNYVYFGLINKAKAFNEMLEAWDRFNTDCKKTLTIISSSKVTGLEKHRNVIYRYNLQENEILQLMMKSAVSIVPVIPEVDMKNATFKTGCMTGCLCIGKFCDQFKKLPFTVNMDNYSIKEFMKALNISKKFDNHQFNELSYKARQYGKRYIPSEAVKIIVSELGILEREK